MKPIIRVENLSKRYTIGGPAEPYSTLREALVKTVKAPFNAFRNGRGNGNEQFWALKDVNFEVMPGEVVGIIGRNGAGKSTLLKILSRITEPTTGKVDLYGRVGSLLEVGTGFHQELTGRENIYLNGAVLGMKRKDISKKFDEIVDFAEIEEFLDTPVKRYSSGMYVRLAFAVAAHLDPEILVIDEVLAVGDAKFQKKCIGKMSEVAKGGRTVLFVSHNALAVSQLCETAVYLESGKVKSTGRARAILGEYQADLEASEIEISQTRGSEDTVKEGEIRYIDWCFEDSMTGQSNSVFSREECKLVLTLVCKRELPNAHLGFVINDSEGRKIVVANSTSSAQGATPLRKGTHKLRWNLSLPVRAGSYELVAAVGSPDEAGFIDEWRAEPRLLILPNLDFAFTEEWMPLLNLPIEFKLD